MKKYLLNLLAIVLAFGLTAFNTNMNRTAKKNALSFISSTYANRTNLDLFTVFEYVGGRQDDPFSYSKVPVFVYLSNYCPGNSELCAIVAEEDIFFNPEHPTQESLDYLLSYFGFYYYFSYEVSGLIEFKSNY